MPRRCLNASRATSRSRSGCRAISGRSSAPTCSPASRSGRCSCRRPSRTRRSPERLPRRGSATALAAGRRVRRLRHLPRARRRPELDDRDHRGSGARHRGGEVPGPGLRDAPRRARPPDRASCSWSPGAPRLGFVSEFLARPVLVGFISGIGVVIIVGQLPKLLGLTVESGNVPETLLARRSASLDEHRLGDAGRRRRAVAASRCSCCAGSRRGCRGRSSSPPSRSALSRAFDLEAHGVAVIADVPGGPADPGDSRRSASARSARSRAERSRSRSSRWRSRSAPPARSPRSAATRSTPTRSSSRSARPTSAPASCRASRSTRASRAARSAPARAFARGSPGCSSRSCSWRRCSS